MASFEDLVALTQATSAGKQAGLSDTQAFKQAVQARNQGNLAQYAQNSTRSGGTTNTGIGTLYADRSEADQAAQQRQKIWSIINGTADRSEYDTIMAQAHGIGNQLKKYDYQGDREEADAVAVAKKRNAEMAKRTQPYFSQYADRSEYDAMQSEKQSLEKKLDEVNNSLAYAVTIDENDALQSQRKDILDRLNKIKETERSNRLYDREAKGREYSSMRNNNDFALYSGIGMGMGYKDNGGYSVSGNKVNFANEYRDVIEKEYAAPHIVNRYSGTNNLWNLTPDEKQTYYYILAKEGEEKADEFLAWMQDTLNYRSAEKVANDIERDSGASRVAREIAAGLVSGNTSALSGIGQNLQSDARATTTDEFLQQMIQQNIAKRTGTENGGYSLEGIASSAANTIGNMIPSMAIGTLNPAAGAVTMGLSAKGNTYKQVLDEGYSKAQAEAVSIPTGIAEAALQYALGGISSLGGKVTNHAVEKATSKISNGLARSLVRLGISNLDEVTEELIQNKIGTVLRNGILGENNSLSWNDDDWDTVLMTIVTTTLLNAPSAIGSSLSSGQNVQGLIQQSTEKASLQNDAAPQNTQQSASDIPGNIQTPPAEQNAPVAYPALFNTQANGVVNTTQQSFSYNNANAAQNQTQYSNSDQNVNGNLRELGNSRNIRTDEAMEPGFRQIFENEPVMYEQLSNKETLAKAQNIFNSGFDFAKEKLVLAIDKAKEGYKLSPEMVPLAKMVENELYRQGNYEEATRIASDIGLELMAAGQLGQANIILRNSSPITVLETIQKAIDRINEEPAVKRGKWEAKLTQEEIDLINSTDFSQDGSLEEVYTKIADRLGEEMPASLWEKLKEIRRVNMLLRPRTQIKNVVGNVPMALMRKSANKLSGAIQDSLVKTGKINKADQTRTSKVTKESREIAKQAYEQHRASLLQESNKWDINSLLRDHRTYFKSKFGKLTYENARQLTYKLLEAGDSPFVRSAFQDSISQYCAAHNITDISQIPYSAVEKAQKDAFDATFKSTSVLSNSINAVKRKGGIAAEVIDVILPFTTTPINIVNQLIEYSPAGFLKSVNQYFNKNYIDAIDSASRATIGSVVIGAGALLRMFGLITGGEDDDKGKAAFDKATGNSPYSFGGVFSYDWAQPAGSLLALGADIYESVKDDKSVSTAIVDALITASDSVLNMSVFSNIVSVLQSGYGSPTEKVLKNAVESFASQMTPGLLGDIAKIADPTVRSTYTGGSMYQNILSRLESNIPGVSKYLPGSVNIKGESISRGNIALRAFNTLINPGNVNTSSKTKYDVALEEIYSSTGNKNVFMEPAPYTVTIESKDITLTGEERSKFQRTMGQAYYGKYLPQAIDSEAFGLLSEEQKVKVLQDLQAQAKYDAMSELASNRGKIYESALDDEASLSDIPAYYSYSTIMREAAFGKPTTDWQSVMKMMQNFTSLPDDVKTELKGKSDMHLKAVEYATNNGLSPEDWYSTYDVIKDAKVSTGSEAQLVSAIAINGTNKNLSDSDKLKMLQSQLPLAKDGKIPTIVRRYDVAMNSYGISFDDWTKLETALKDSDSTSKWSIRSAAQSVGINQDDAVKIYKTLYSDPNYTAQVNEEFLYLNPVDESGEVEPMSFTEYYNSFNEDQTPQETTTGFTPGITPGMTENDYQKLMRMARG